MKKFFSFIWIYKTHGYEGVSLWIYNRILKKVCRPYYLILVKKNDKIIWLDIGWLNNFMKEEITTIHKMKTHISPDLTIVDWTKLSNRKRFFFFLVKGLLIATASNFIPIHIIDNRIIKDFFKFPFIYISIFKLLFGKGVYIVCMWFINDLVFTTKNESLKL